MDNLINMVGPFGRFQKFALLMIGLVSSLSSMTVYATIFLAANPKFYCTENDQHGGVDHDADYCHLRPHLNTSSSNIKCHFDNSYYTNTIVTEWMLICEDKYLVGLTQTIYLIGTICGLFIGNLSDQFGRKKCLFLLSCSLSIVLISCEFLQLDSIFNFSRMTKYIIYCVGQFLVGGLSKAIYLVGYILLIEYTSSEYSTLVSNINVYMCVFGELVTLVIAYFFRDWHVLNWTMGFYSIILIFITAYFLPESPRFLISNGYLYKANKVLKKISVFNGNPAIDLIDQSATNKLITKTRFEMEMSKSLEDLDSDTKNGSIWYPRENFIKSVVFIYLWLSITLLYFGISLGITSLNLPIDPYLMYLLSSFAEFIGYSICHLNDKIGKKRAFIGYLITASVVCLIVAIIPLLNDQTDFSDTYSINSILKIVFALIGKAMVSAVFNLCYVYNSLLYSTQMRSTAVIFASNVGSIGAFISPQINLLQTIVWEPLPYIIFSGSAFLASFFIFLLPNPDNITFD